MNAHGSPGHVALKSFLVVLLVVLAFQSLGSNGLAAPANSSRDLQNGETTPVLTCSCASIHLQIVLLIDDSGSMRSNDPQFIRNQSARDLVNGLSTLPNARVAVIHFTEGLKEKPEWLEINPGSLDELHKHRLWKRKHYSCRPQRVIVLADRPCFLQMASWKTGRGYFTVTNF